MDVNKENGPFEKMIKLIIMGSNKEEPSFRDNCIELLDEPWFILRSIGLSRKNSQPNDE